MPPVPPSSPSVRSDEFPAGPWRCAFWVEVPIPIRSKSNFRRYAAGGDGSDWREHQVFQKTVGTVVASARPDAWDASGRQVRVAARPPVVAFVAAASRLDAANFSKSVLDACEGVLFVSDASVLGTASVGVRSEGSVFALGFAQLEPGSGPQEVHSALTELGALILGRFTFH